MKINYLVFVCLLLSISALIACDTADRGGVTLEPKLPPPGAPPRPDISSDEKPVSIISGTAKCLSVNPEDYLNDGNGSRVYSWDCIADSVFQSWFLTLQKEILSTNGQCLGLSGELGSDAKVVLNNCDGSIAQRWIMDDHISVIHNEAGFNFCLEASADSIRTNGTSLRLMPCNGTATQQWATHVLKRQHLASVTDPELLINIEPQKGNSTPAATPIIGGWISAEWTLEPVWNYYRIRNQWKQDHFLHVEYGALEAGPIQYHWESAFWALIRQDSSDGAVYLLRNVWQEDTYIGMDENNLLKAAPFNNLVDGSTLWRITEVKQAK